jgi:hypothetical protein
MNWAKCFLSCDRSGIDFHRTGAAALDFSGRQREHRFTTKLAAGYAVAHLCKCFGVRWHTGLLGRYLFLIVINSSESDL